MLTSATMCNQANKWLRETVRSLLFRVNAEDFSRHLTCPERGLLMIYSSGWVMMAGASYYLLPPPSSDCVPTHHHCHAAFQNRGVELGSDPWGCCLCPPSRRPSSHPRALVPGRHCHRRPVQTSRTRPPSGCASPALPRRRGYCRGPGWETWIHGWS